MHEIVSFRAEIIHIQMRSDDEADAFWEVAIRTVHIANLCAEMGENGRRPEWYRAKKRH